MRNHLRNIRSSSQQTKRAWLIGLSVTATILVVIVWVFYMRAFVFTGSTPDTEEDVRIGFWPVFKNGLTITGASVNKTLGNVLSEIPAFGGSKTTIQNPE